MQKKVSEEDSADYTVRSYRITIPGGVNSDAIIVKSKVPTFQKLAELKSAGELDGPITLNDFGAHIDADQLHLRLGELIREAIATDLKISSNTNTKTKTNENAATETTTRWPVEVDAIIKAHSFVPAVDDESIQRTLAALAESKKHLQKVITLLADSSEPANQLTKADRLATPEPTTGGQVRGPVVVREDTEEKNRSDQAEDDSGGPTLTAGGNGFEMGEQKYRDLIMQMQTVVENAKKPAEASDGANSSGGSKKDEL